MVSDNRPLVERVRQRVAGVIAGRTAISITGTVRVVRGDGITALVPAVSVGEMASIERPASSPVRCVVVGVEGNKAFLSPLDDTAGIAGGAAVQISSARLHLSLPKRGPFQMIDSMGDDIHQSTMEEEPEKKLISVSPRWQVRGEQDEVTISDAPARLSEVVAEENPLARRRFETGIRSIDALCPLAEGQRVAVIAPPGCGKSTLLLQLATQARYDVLVMALVGERRREIRECEGRLRRLVEQGRRAVVIAEPSDASPMRRLLASQAAVASAEYFASKRNRVLLVIDSLTRVARAMREVGLMRGEKIVRGGYTASVYTELPRLLERAGPCRGGVITAFHSLLSHDERDVDPLKEEVISLLDGHLVLSESLARRGVYPAIHPTQSLSRLAGELESGEERRRRLGFLAGWERLERDRDTILLGGRPDAELKKLLQAEPLMTSFLSQAGGEVVSVQEGQRFLLHVLGAMRGDTANGGSRLRLAS